MLTVMGTTAFTVGDGDDITLDSSASNYAGNVTFMSSAGRVNDIEITDNSDFGIQSGLNITGNLSITATGSDIVQYGEAIVGGNLSVTGRDITLDDTDNDFSTVRLSGRDVVLADSDGIDLGTSTVTNLNITAGGAVTDSGALTVTGTANISANSGMSRHHPG